MLTNHMNTIWIGLLFSSSVFAWPPTFGPEFTFTNNELKNAATTPTSAQTKENLAALNQWKNKIEELCKNRADCIVEAFNGKHGKAYRVQYNDGFWYSVGLDVGVLEISTQPNTKEGFSKHRARMQLDIFDFAQSLGLAPHERLGQGHINIGLQSAFEDDALLFRNFIVDTINHPELHQGILGIHQGNSPTITMLGESAQKAIHKVIADFDHNHFNFYELSRRIESQVYTSNPNGWTPQYYQNHRLSSISQRLPIEQRRLEVRGVRPQKSMDEFLLLCDLFENWLSNLKSRNRPIPLQIPTSAHMSPGELKARFQDFLESIGKNKHSYDLLLTEKIRAASPDRSTIPFNEISLTGARYARVNEVASNLSSKQISEFTKKAYESSASQRNLHFFPKILSQKENEDLVAGTNQRARAIKAFLEDIHSGKKNAINAGVLPKDVLKRILTKAETSEEKIRKIPWDRTGFYYAPDVVRHSDGKFYVLEDNTGYAGGMGDSVSARHDLLKFIPQYQDVLKDGATETFAKKIAETLRGMAQNKADAVVFVIPASEVNYNAILVRQLREFGVQTVTENGLKNADGTVFRIGVEDNGWAYLYEKRGSFESKKKLGALGIRNFSQSGFSGLFPRTYKAWANGKVAVLGYPFTGYDVLGDKEFTGYVDDLIRFYLKEEPILPTVPTFSFREIGPNNTTILKKAEFDKVFNDLSKYVIKDTQGLQGKGVYIGSKLSEVEIQELKQKVIKNPGAYIAQQKIVISTIGDQISDLRIFSTVTKDAVRTSDQFWGRTLSVHGNGLLNTHQNAKVIPIFVEGRDTVPIKAASISDHPRQLNVSVNTSQISEKKRSCLRGFFKNLFKI